MKIAQQPIKQTQICMFVTTIFFKINQMKKTILAIAVLLTAINLKAQHASTRLGFDFSPQISWMMSDDDRVSSNGLMGGYNFGLIIDRFFAPNYAFATGIFINTTGGKLNYKDGTSMVIGNTPHENIHKFSYRLKYLEVPMGIKLLTNQHDRNRFYLQMGFSNQFLIKTNDGNGKSIKDEVRFYNFGYQLGGGIEHSLGSNLYLRTGLLFHSSLTDITSNNSYDDKALMRKFVLNASLIF